MILRKCIIALLLLTSVSASLQARPLLENASPASGEAVGNPPSHILLSFSEALVPSSTDAVVRNASGGVVSSGKARVSAKEGRVKIPVKKLPPGKYRVEWYATSAGERHAQGSFSFVVGNKDDGQQRGKHIHRHRQ
jgi:copper transport protein